MLRRKRIETPAPASDVLLGTYDPDTDLTVVIADFNKAAKRIIDRLVQPIAKPTSERRLVTENGVNYHVNPNTQLLRRSWQLQGRRSHAAKRQVADDVTMMFANPHTTAPYRTLLIHRRRVEWRKGRKMPSAGLVDRELSIGLFDKDYTKAPAVLVEYIDFGDYANGNFRVRTEEKQHIGHLAVRADAPELNRLRAVREMDELAPGLIGNIATTLNIAEAVSERIPSTVFPEPFIMLPPAAGFSSSIDPHR